MADDFGQHGAVEQATTHDPLAKLITSGGKANATLDAIVDQDGSYEGDDTGNLAENFAIERTAEHDAAYSILLALNDLHEDQDQLTTSLQNVVDSSHAVRGQTSENKYTQARGRQARIMLQVLKLGGMPALERNARSSMRLPQVKLHRMTS